MYSYMKPSTVFYIRTGTLHGALGVWENGAHWLGGDKKRW